MAILESVTPLVEQLSIDEAFLDVGGVRRRHGTGERRRGAAARHAIRAETGLTAVGRRRDDEVPRQARERPREARRPARRSRRAPSSRSSTRSRSPACGASAPRRSAQLDRMASAHDRRRRARSTEAGPRRRARDVARPRTCTRWRATTTTATVVPDRDTKSIGAEETFGTDLHTDAECERELVRLADRVDRARARAPSSSARTVTLKIRFADFETQHAGPHAARTRPTSPRSSPTPRASCSTRFDVARGVRLLGVSLSQPRARGRGRSRCLAARRRRRPRRTTRERAHAPRSSARSTRCAPASATARSARRRSLDGGRREPMIRIGLVGCGHIGTVHAYAIQQLIDGRARRRGAHRDLRHRPRTRRRAVARHHGGAPRRDARGARRRGRRGVGLHVDRRPPRSGRARGRRGPRGLLREAARADARRLRARRRRARSASRTRSASCCAARRCSRRAAELIASGRLRPAARDDVPRRPVLPDPGPVRIDVAQGRRVGRAAARSSSTRSTTSTCSAGCSAIPSPSRARTATPLRSRRHRRHRGR